jgi:hypothetical protein
MNTSTTQSPDSLGSPSGSAFAEQARKNIGKWGKQDLETLGLAIAEETGELCQAVLKARWEGGDRSRIREEAIDLGALCIQIIHCLDNPPCAACDRGDFQLGHSDFCPQNNPLPRRPR